MTKRGNSTPWYKILLWTVFGLVLTGGVMAGGYYLGNHLEKEETVIEDVVKDETPTDGEELPEEEQIAGDVVGE